MAAKGKIYYYNAFVTCNDQKTTIPFSKLVNQVALLDEDLKFKETRHGEYSLLKMRPPLENRDVNDRSMCFANYRTRKPKVGEKRSSILEDIKGDVLETTNCFYQHTNKLLVMEYNHYGAKANQIESYLTTFLPETENEIWAVELVEIEAPIGVKDVLNSDDIRNIDIKLDVSASQKRRLNPKESKRSVILNVVEDMTKAHSLLGGNVAQLNFGNGRKKDNPLNPEEVKKLINIMDLESDLYISIKVKYYSKQLKKMHDLDLKNASILKKDVEFEGDAWETIADTLEATFYEDGRVGQNQYQKFDKELIRKNYGDIVLTKSLKKD